MTCCDCLYWEPNLYDYRQVYDRRRKWSCNHKYIRYHGEVHGQLFQCPWARPWWKTYKA